MKYGYVKKFYLSNIFMVLVIFCLLSLLNITEVNQTITLQISVGALIMIGIFLIQSLLFLNFIKNNKLQLLKIFKKNIILGGATHVMLGTISIISAIIFIFYNYRNIIWCLFLIIMAVELIITRLIEVENVNLLKLSRFNAYFSPIYNIEAIKNKNFRNLYNKGESKITDLLFIPIFTFFIFYIAYLRIFSPMNGMYMYQNIILVLILNYLMNKRTLFIIDKILSNYIIIECTYLDNFTGGGAHPSRYSTYYYVNNSMKLKLSIDYLRTQDLQVIDSHKKNHTFVIGGISHRIIDVL